MSQETQTSVEVADAGEAPEGFGAGGFSSLVPMILIFVVFYFLLIRPQEKKRKAQEKLVSTVKPGENVITHSGMFGRIVSVNENDNSVSLEVAKNVEIKIMKSAIADITNRKDAPAKPAISKVEKAAAANKPAKAIKKAAAKKSDSAAKKPAAKPTPKNAPAKKAAPKKTAAKKAKK